jgi:sugar/nucleoside kinase (ribokinase family)
LNMWIVQGESEEAGTRKDGCFQAAYQIRRRVKEGSMAHPQIVFIGSPSTDRLTRGGATREAIGGAAFISALAARAGGADVGIVARVPPLLPASIAQTFGPGGLAREGLVPADGALPTFHILYDEADRATYTHLDNGLEDQLCAADLPASWLMAPWVHLAAIGEDANRQLAFLDGLESRGFSGKISAGTYRRMIERNPEAARTLMSRSDLFFCNEEEFGLLCSDELPEGTVICVTRGSEGVRIIGGPSAGEHAPPPADVVDATGAGDAFCGGFLSGVVTGQDPVSSGAEAARRVLSGVGASTLIEEVAAGIGARALAIPERIDRVAQTLSQVARAAILDFTYAPHLPEGHPQALAMLCISTMHQFGFWNSDPAKGWLTPMYAEIDGIRYKGSDFIWAAFARAAREDPSLFDLDRMATEAGLLPRICMADDGTCPLPELETFVELHMAHGQHMLRCWPGGYTELVEECNSHSAPVQRLLEHLSVLPGYAEDPLAKKANLLAIVLGNRPEHFLELRDREHIRPIVDYHLMRGCLRTGCVDLVDPDLQRRSEARQWVDGVEERAIRDAAKIAIDRLVDRSGTSVAAVDGFFFTLGRRLCLEMEQPRCDECPLEPACGKHIERFQPVYRTSFY